MAKPQDTIPTGDAVIVTLDTPRGTRWSFRKYGQDYSTWLLFTSYEACVAAANNTNPPTVRS